MAAVNYDTLLFEFEATDEANRSFAYGGNGAGAPYVLSQINGAWQEVPDFLDSQHAIETREDAQAYLARLEAFARMMDDEVERVRRDVGLGVVPPDYAITGALAGMKLLRAAPETSTLVTSLANRAKAKGLAGDWMAQGSAVYTGKIVPALDRQMALLESLKPKAVHDAGCWRLPDGQAYYAQALFAQTTSRITPDEVHKLGRDVTAELSARADVLFKEIGFTQGTVGERYIALYDSKKGVYPNTDAGKAEIIADLNKVVQAMQKRLPEQFGDAAQGAAGDPADPARHGGRRLHPLRGRQPRWLAPRRLLAQPARQPPRARTGSCRPRPTTRAFRATTCRSPCSARPICR